ncbi:hypothetical protein GF367_01990 [Candidatus Woesearchaeota archaeon]|nr:hypothetical protein [Candidatus Woesearchaeota archaeon]
MAKLKTYTKKFETFIKQHGLFPEKKDYYALISGGKDSSALIILLEEYKKKHQNFQCTYLNIAFPQDLYGEDIIQKQTDVGKGLKNFTSIIPAQARNILLKEQEPCLKCKEIRCDEIANYLKKKDLTNTVIITGHTNDDLIAYFTELFGLDIRTVLDTIDYERLKRIILRDNQLEHFSRFFPKLTLQNGITLVKPLLSFTTRDIKDLFKLTNTDKRLVTSCIFSCRRPKRNLFQVLDYLPPKEAQPIYRHHTYTKLNEQLKKHVLNYDDATKHLKEYDYKELLL